MQVRNKALQAGVHAEASPWIDRRLAPAYP